MSVKKRAFIFSAVLVILSVAVVVTFGFSLYRYAHSPSGSDSESKIIEVLPGQGFSRTTVILSNEGIVLSPARFKLVAAITGKDKKIKAGEYLLSATMTPSDIISALVNAKVYQRKVTVPEGYNIKQVAETVERAGICKKEDFEIAANDALTATGLGVPESAWSCEGYLFPETYFYPKNTNPAVIVRDMVRRFRLVYKPEWDERAEEIGLTRHQVVTLASIIEKETGAAKERPLISSVFHNRLRKDMRLETDPTVIYGVENFDGNLTRKHLRTPGPYNTYLNKGLPPGPIANPGYESIKAALYPVDSSYLFFVSRKDGTHEFSVTYEEHVNNIRIYQLAKRQPQNGKTL